MTDVPLSCACGAVRGRVSVDAKRANRVICHCIDCRAFANWLATDDVLDAWGGTDIGQVEPAAVEFTAGTELLAAMQLSPKGLLRWYTTCCKTPVGNTMATGTPLFLGLIHSICSHDEAARTHAFQSEGTRCHLRRATGDCGALTGSQTFPIGMSLRLATLIARWTWAGRPSPLTLGGPHSVTPTILSEAERARLETPQL